MSLQRNIENTVNIITAPAAAFRSIAEKPTIIFPLLLLMVTTIATHIYFFSVVDYAWMIDQMVEVQSIEKSTEEKKAIRAAMGSMSASVMMSTTIIGMVVTIPIIFSIVALYLMFASKLIDSRSSNFKSWFSLVCWCSVPGIFSQIASFVNVALVESGKITLEQVNPINFNNLFFHVDPSSPLFGLLSSLDPIVIWGQVLMIIGFSHWTGKSLALSTAIVLAPIILIYGIWIGISVT